MKKETFYGINEIHTLQVPNDSMLVYVGMSVQSNKKKSEEEIVMIFYPEQLMEIYDYMVQRMIEKADNNFVESEN